MDMMESHNESEMEGGFMNRKSIRIHTCIILCLTVILSACTAGTTESEQHLNRTDSSLGGSIQATVDSEASLGVLYDEDDSDSSWKDKPFNTIELLAKGADFKGTGAIVRADEIIINLPGVYVISGEWKEGQIVVNSEIEGTVQLVLNGVSLHKSNSAPIYIMNAGKTILTLQEGTDNIISDGAEYVYADSSDDEPAATIFSKDNLTINGTGTLTVNANHNNAIMSKDDLKIMDGTLNINSVDDGLVGRDLLAVKAGHIMIDADGDGMKSTNDKDTAKGQIVLEGGSYDIRAGADGIQSVSSLVITGGQFTIHSGGGAGNSDASESSCKGLKAATELVISGGTFLIDAADDAVHSNDLVTITAGEFSITAGDDGIHADTSLTIEGGNIDILSSYEGIESKLITITDGEIHIVSSDDGVNVAGGNDGNPMNRRFGRDSFSADGDSKLVINGGYMAVDAAGDGLDSNGSIEMTGGTVIVNGPTANNNGALDYDGSFTISGGTLITAGSSGMAQAPSDKTSTQYSILMYYSQLQQAGTLVHLVDSKGVEIATFAPVKDYQSIVISSPLLSKDETYTIYSGGSAAGVEKDGLYSETDVTADTELISFTIHDMVTWMSESGATTSRGFGPGGGGGRRGR